LRTVNENRYLLSPIHGAPPGILQRPPSNLPVRHRWRHLLHACRKDTDYFDYYAFTVTKDDNLVASSVASTEVDLPGDVVGQRVPHLPPTDQLGLQARDTFASLKKTCRRLGVNFWACLQDHVRGLGQIPGLADLIRQKAEEMPARKTVAAPLAEADGGAVG
jgi:hypothetical protein